MGFKRRALASPSPRSRARASERDATNFDGVWLQRAGDYYFLIRIYPDGELIDQLVVSAGGRERVLGDVMHWFHRDMIRCDGLVSWTRVGERLTWTRHGLVVEATRRPTVYASRDGDTLRATISDDATGVHFERVYKRLGSNDEFPPPHIDINQADLEHLAAIPNISRKVAERIVAARNARGGFRSVEELSEVKGIGPSTFDFVRPMLTV